MTRPTCQSQPRFATEQTGPHGFFTNPLYKGRVKVGEAAEQGWPCAQSRSLCLMAAHFGVNKDRFAPAAKAGKQSMPVGIDFADRTPRGRRRWRITRAPMRLRSASISADEHWRFSDVAACGSAGFSVTRSKSSPSRCAEVHRFQGINQLDCKSPEQLPRREMGLAQGTQWCG